MILSASRRTDIPCYYSEWLLNRLKAGYVLTRNPFRPRQIRRVPLTPQTVDCIVFWTKDAQNILTYLNEIQLMGYRFLFQFTLTPYDHSLEPNLRNKGEIEKTFLELSDRIGKDSIIWRYDPIILNDTITIEYHQYHFARLCKALAPYTNKVIISFVDQYAKRKTPLIRPITEREMEELGATIGSTAKEYGLPVQSCCEGMDLTTFGIGQAGCLTKEVLQRVCGYNLELKRDKNQRPGCHCVESVDIGAYNTCPNGCVYCYANRPGDLCHTRYHKADPFGELLAGRVQEGDKVLEKEYFSNRIGQLVLE